MGTADRGAPWEPIGPTGPDPGGFRLEKAGDRRADARPVPGLNLLPARGVRSDVGAFPARTATALIASTRADRAQVTRHRLSDVRGLTVLDRSVACPDDLLAQVRSSRPGLMFIDQEMASCLDGARVHQLRTCTPCTRVLVVCAEPRSRAEREALERGFQGVLHTDDAADTWTLAVCAVLRGELWMTRASLERALVETFGSVAGGSRISLAEDAPPPPVSALTQREEEIVQQLRQGLSNKEIARRLGVKEDTVKKHLQSVFTKLGVRRRAQVVLMRQHDARQAS